MNSTKINIQVKASKNYNSVTVGIEDHPILFNDPDEFQKHILALGDELNESCKGILANLCADER